jgi:hypothetical protein
MKPKVRTHLWIPADRRKLKLGLVDEVAKRLMRADPDSVADSLQRLAEREERLDVSARADDENEEIEVGRVRGVLGLLRGQLRIFSDERVVRQLGQVMFGVVLELDTTIVADRCAGS